MFHKQRPIGFRVTDRITQRKERQMEKDIKSMIWKLGSYRVIRGLDAPEGTEVFGNRVQG